MVRSTLVKPVTASLKVKVTNELSPILIAVSSTTTDTTVGAVVSVAGNHPQEVVWGKGVLANQRIKSACTSVDASTPTSVICISTVDVLASVSAQTIVSSPLWK